MFLKHLNLKLVYIVLSTMMPATISISGALVSVSKSTRMKQSPILSLVVFKMILYSTVVFLIAVYLENWIASLIRRLMYELGQPGELILLYCFWEFAFVLLVLMMGGGH